MLYPEKEDISDVERIGLSIVLSIGSVLLLVLFIDEVLALNTTPANIAGAILVFSLLAVCIWKAEQIFNEKIQKFQARTIKVRHGILPVRLSGLHFRSKSGKTDSVDTESAKGKKNDDL